MLDQIDAIAEMIEGGDFAAYRRDVKLRRATERCVEIISEASRHLPIASRSLPELRPAIVDMLERTGE